jgi:DNA/RNA endonuclease YhcR with UshA esterase domain
VEIHGEIVLYKEKPEIELRVPEDFRVVE